MADYQPDRVPQSRQHQQGHAENYQRDAAFSNIFGAAPPPGRSQTMTSSVHPPEFMQPGRTQTMTSTSGLSDMHRPPPQRPPPQGAGGGGYGGTMPRQRPNDRGGYDYYQSQGQPRSASGPNQVPSPQYLQQQQQRRPFPGSPPQGQQQYPPQQYNQQYQQRQGLPQRPNQGTPPQDYHNSQQTPTQRFYQGGRPAPAMNADPYRSQSLASYPRATPMYQPPQQQYQQQAPSANARHAQYSNQHSARTTAHGRVVPERHFEDRSNTMTGYPSHDRDSHQTMSGRVIPNRRPAGRDSGSGSVTADYLANTSPNPGPAMGYGPPGSQTRTVSMASSIGNDSQRTMSMASTITPSIAPTDRSDTTVVQRSSVGSERPPTARIRPPIVYPALLSRVAECFRRKIVVGDRTKNELTYTNAFSGAEAVDVLSYIIRTTDRNLALLLGRALDAQKFFHDVQYEHRLRDSTYEMYQFRETMSDEANEEPGVNGVFVLLSECYSPTCTRDQLCYSIACPRRLEQVSRLNLKMGPGLKREGEASVGDDDVDQTDEQRLWINSVPKEIADSIGDREKKRQEVIAEVCYTERDFVKDLEYLRDFWIYPLRGKINGLSPIPPQRREKVVKTIFSNIIDPPSIHAVSSKFARSLTERQQKAPVVKNIGDVFLEYVPHFEPFIHYGSKQLEGKHEFENERSINKDFASFVDEIERRRESRKLELNGYLTKPTTRLARYPLLLENVLKYTEDGNPDKEDLPKVLTLIRDFLSKVNAESGKAENRFNLRRLHENLKFRPNEKVDLKLTHEGREMVYKTQFKKSPAETTADITAFLFDHAILLVRIKQVGKTEDIKAYRRPIPLELLSIKEMDEVIPQSAVKRTSSSLLPLRAATDTKKGEWPVTFRHLGKNGYELTLYATNQSGRQKWLEFIDAAQSKLRARADFFNTTVISSGFFSSQNKINCITPFDGGRKLIYGTDSGIYMSDRRSKDGNAAPRRVIDVTGVTQVDVLEEYQLLLVLSNKSLLSYQLGALDPNEPISSKRAKKIQNHCNFFKTGICLGRHLVCCVRSSALSTTIKVYEPNDAMSRTKKQKGLSKMFNAGQDELKPFKEFYIPTESTSVHFLKSKLCVACARGFEVVSLETLETQSLLDQADTSLDFVSRKEGVKPIHIERLNGEFLLNYSEFSFYVNRNGWRAKPEWRLDWEGSPQAFALSYPWILAFEPNFIELRHLENLSVHIVPHRNLRMLHCSTHEVSTPRGREGDSGGQKANIFCDRSCLPTRMRQARM
ncbi:putative rho1 guanine nucleotide exchange factor 1 [Triangularia verruculosa]|uniref:Rho1 guanine nucleotide exchange factor 1 n=1 Tax=Triangularia verruculosa TaxID=2587418 RepID=A0AAN6X9B9_9PEZI|nr:putative rho1 guanine nucleotide exchange factor 1 [Triangularia verruculosa]